MPRTVLNNLILNILRFYQRFLSPLFGNHCRFYPSCSQYAVLSIEKYGAIRGLGLALWRVLRCNPLIRGGVNIP